MNEVNAKNRFKNYHPTCELRWNTKPFNPNGDNAAIPWIGKPIYRRILEQKWESHMTNEFPIWRQVPEFYKAGDYET